ncbi:MAG: SgcJ/EcaC family oxidoreductase [Cyanobacteria bacterium P01_G01_bin.49]
MTCVKTNEQEIAGLFDRWNQSLATLDPDRVVANYASDAILLPTVSKKPRTNYTEIREYFVDFLKHKPHGVIDFRVIKIGCNAASDTGLYTFTLYEKNGEVRKVAARYSYVYAYRNGTWLIEHHHSSAMPEAD